MSLDPVISWLESLGDVPKSEFGGEVRMNELINFPASKRRPLYTTEQDQIGQASSLSGFYFRVDYSAAYSAIPGFMIFWGNIVLGSPLMLWLCWKLIQQEHDSAIIF